MKIYGEYSMKRTRHYRMLNNYENKNNVLSYYYLEILLKSFLLIRVLIYYECNLDLDRLGCGAHNYASKMECYKCRMPRQI
ncbi:hypothetical protein ACSBR1_025995 [Camellia fascicularis]